MALNKDLCIKFDYIIQKWSIESDQKKRADMNKFGNTNIKRNNLTF